jgi:hypothetical protein
MKKLYYIIGSVFAFLGITNIAKAVEFDEDHIRASVSSALDTTVTSIISTAVDFLTNNLPLIITLGVAVGILFWLIRKAVRAIKGKA